MTSLPTLRPFFLGLTGILLAIAAQWLLRDGAEVEAALFFGVALLIVLFAFWQQHEWSPPLEPQEEIPGWRGLLPAWRSPWFWAGTTLVITSLVLMVLGLRLFRGDESPPISAWYFHLTGVVVLIVAVFCLDNRTLLPLTSSGERGSNTVPSRVTSLWILVAILAAALIMRLLRFDSLPFGTWYDEAENGLQALRILENPDYRPVFVNSTHAPAHYIYLIAAAFKTIGVSTQSIRFVSVVLGVGTVLGGFLLGRELLGRVGGLMLAVMLAFSRWDVNLSRIGMYNISTPLFALLTAGFLLRAIRRRRMSDFGLAGLMMGSGLSFYSAFQLFAFVVLFLLLAWIVLRRGFLRIYWPGLMALTLMAVVVFAPVILFAYENPDEYLGRTRDTSLFADKAEEERLPALVENARKHILMFNVRGDPNGRHNLPGDPMLDPVSAALMILGLGVALRYASDPNWLILPIWLIVMLLGGVLSLDFEAPQSLRAVGTLPVAYLLATVPLVLLWRAWMRSDGWRYPGFFAWVALVFLLPMATINARGYFVHWANDFASWNAFSTPETLAANLLIARDEGTDAHVISFYNGHPTLNFLAGYDQGYQRLETTDSLPLPLDPNRSALFIVDGERKEFFERARDLYPSAQLVEHKPPFPAPTVLYSMELAPDDVASIQGLTGRYYADANLEGASILTRQDATINFDWTSDTPLPPPFSAEWEGVLRVEEYGPHQLSLQSPAETALFIDGELVLEGSGELDAGLVLAKGNHTIRVRASVADEEMLGPLVLAWRPPDRGPEIIPPQVLYSNPVNGNGLLGRYYPNDSWSAPEAFAQIDPQLDLYFHIIPLDRPYTVEWSGQIAIPQSGFYGFGLESIDESWLFIDGQEITSSLGANEYSQGEIELNKGLYDVRVRFADSTDHTHINFYWNPPWGGQQIVPSQVLFPPRSGLESISLPTLSELGFQAQQTATSGVGTEMTFASVETVASGLNSPKGVAVADNGRIFVAEPSNQIVTIYGEDGERQGQILGVPDDNGNTVPFVEPFDLAVGSSSDGTTVVYVLDAGVGTIHSFDGQGDYLDEVNVESGLLERARGIDVDSDGNIWIAQTPGGRIISLAHDGALRRELPVWPGEAAQPVDVLVAGDATIFVADSELHKLVRYDGDGRRLLAWELPVANSIDGTHLAEGSDGRIYFTIPEQAQIWTLDPTSGQLARRAVPLPEGPKPKLVGIDVGPDDIVWSADTDGGRLIRVSDE